MVKLSGEIETLALIKKIDLPVAVTASLSGNH
jgi:hypothetical protein